MKKKTNGVCRIIVTYIFSIALWFLCAILVAGHKSSWQVLPFIMLVITPAIASILFKVIFAKKTNYFMILRNLSNEQLNINQRFLPTYNSIKIKGNTNHPSYARCVSISNGVYKDIKLLFELLVPGKIYSIDTHEQIYKMLCKNNDIIIIDAIIAKATTVNEYKKIYGGDCKVCSSCKDVDGYFNCSYSYLKERQKYSILFTVKQKESSI